MKVLIVASYPTSVLSFRGHLIRDILGRGHLISVAATDWRSAPGIQSKLEQLGIVTHDLSFGRTSTNPVSDLALIWKLIKLMRVLSPDIFLGYTIKPAIYGLIAARLLRVPNRYALITGLGFSFTGGRDGLLSALVKRMYKIAVSKASKVFFQNPDDQSLFRVCGVLADEVPSVVVNGSGVDVSVYGLAALPVVRPTFLMISRLLGDKGTREYARAAARVRAANPDVQLGLAGWIDDNPDAISQAELNAWIDEGSIKFLGRLEDVRPAIADCTVYVLPSYREGTPRTVLEAMAMGRPVITTDAPGCRETVVEGENGFLVPVKSVDALAEAMQKFIDDPELAVRMGKRSREIAEEKYDVHKVNAVMLREMGIT